MVSADANWPYKNKAKSLSILLLFQEVVANYLKIIFMEGFSKGEIRKASKNREWKEIENAYKKIIILTILLTVYDSYNNA